MRQRRQELGTQRLREFKVSQGYKVILEVERGGGEEQASKGAAGKVETPKSLAIDTMRKTLTNQNV